MTNKQFVAGFTWTRSSSSLFEARFGWSRTEAGKNPAALGTTGALEAYGIRGLPADSRIAGGLPTQLVTPFSDWGRQATNPQWQYPEVWNPKINYTWVRGRHSLKTGSEFQHIATDNYFMPIFLGVRAPAGTNITNDYKTAAAYETRKATRDEIVADLTKSFAHVKQAILATKPEQLSESISMFGQTFTRQQVLILTATHLHEHLGQLIAYARSNSIKPPWSD